ncbi:MAG: hypothetical protein WB498_00100 [Candidatus Binatus sp.]
MLSETNPIASAFWLASAEAPASQVASASSYRVTENVGISAIVMPELKLVQVERQVFLRHIVVGAYYPTFQETPKVFDILGMYLAANVFACRMADYSMLAPVYADRVVGWVFVGCYQVNFARTYLVHETSKTIRAGILDNFADYISLAADRADDGGFAAHAGNVLFLIPVAVPVLATDARFVHFHDTHEFLEVRIGQSRAQTVTHEPCSPIGAGSDHSVNLQSTDALLTGQHQVQNLEPRQEWIVGVLEDRVDRNGEPVRRARILSTLGALPVEGPRLTGVNLFIPAARASDNLRPTLVAQIRLAGIFIGKHSVESRKGQLFNELRFMFGVIILVHEPNIAHSTVIVKGCIIALKTFHVKRFCENPSRTAPFLTTS